MDEQEFIKKFQSDIRERFLSLTDEEKDIVRQNTGTSYTRVLTKIFGAEFISGLGKLRPAQESVSIKRGLAAR
ncbi:MAG: hypothetical protein VW496_00340 [Pelagibacteraceae bacterium]